MYKVVIDPGHGGSDPGAIGTLRTGKKVYESNIALSICEKIIKLFQNDKNIYIYSTRNKDVCVSLGNRCKLSNDINADLFVSVHCNSYDGKKDNIPAKDPKGTEIHIYSGGRDKFTKEYELEFRSSFKYEPYRDIKISPGLYVLNGTICKAYLVETLFIDSEADIIYDTKVQDIFAKIVHNSILSYFGIKFLK